MSQSCMRTCLVSMRCLHGMRWGRQSSVNLGRSSIRLFGMGVFRVPPRLSVHTKVKGSHHEPRFFCDGKALKAWCAWGQTPGKLCRQPLCRQCHKRYLRCCWKYHGKRYQRSSVASNYSPVGNFSALRVFLRLTYSARMPIGSITEPCRYWWYWSGAPEYCLSRCRQAWFTWCAHCMKLQRVIWLWLVYSDGPIWVPVFIFSEGYCMYYQAHLRWRENCWS